MAKSRERSKGITLFVSSAGKLTLPPTINYTTRIKEMVGVVEYVLWPSLIVMVPTSFAISVVFRRRHNRRWCRAAIESIGVNNNSPKFRGMGRLYRCAWILGGLFGNANGDFPSLDLRHCHLSPNQWCFIARSRQYFISRRMHLLLFCHNLVGSEINVSHDNTIRNDNYLLPSYHVMLRKAPVTRMVISLHPLHHDMCLVAQRLSLSQNSPFPVLPCRD